jgi:hypothetical protein
MKGLLAATLPQNLLGSCPGRRELLHALDALGEGEILPEDDGGGLDEGPGLAEARAVAPLLVDEFSSCQGLSHGLEFYP